MELVLLEKFYIKAIWIQYAMIEDRFNSIVRHSYPEKGVDLLKTLRGLDNKLDHIVNRIHIRDEKRKKTVYKPLLEKIKVWKDERNYLMHEITNSPDMNSIQIHSMKLAKIGSTIVRELAGRTWQYKRMIKK